MTLLANLQLWSLREHQSEQPFLSEDCIKHTHVSCLCPTGPQLATGTLVGTQRVGCGSSAPHSPHHTGHIESAPAISVWFIISPALAQGLSPAPAAPAGREKRQPPTLPGINLFSPRLKLGYLGPNSFSSVNWQSFIAFRKGSWPFAFIPSDGQLIAWHSLKIGTDGSSTGELLLLISAALRREGADFQRQSCAELRQSNPAVSCRGQPGFTQIYSMHGWMKGGTSEEQSYCAWHNQREVTGINHNLHYYL